MESREATRRVPFEVRSTIEDGDGLTMTGYAAVFNQPARINSWEGEFDEIIRPGAFAASLARQTPVLMFDHGQHPLLGSIPIGRYTDVHEDDHGLHVEARFHENWLTEPIRDAIREGSISGMSFRFREPDDVWTKRNGDVPLREITKASVPEMGPVVFPAYEGTEVGVRALADALRSSLDGAVERATNLTLTDGVTQLLTGSGARGADGGEPDRERQEPTPSTPIPDDAARYRALRTFGVIK